MTSRKSNVNRLHIKTVTLPSEEVAHLHEIASDPSQSNDARRDACEKLIHHHAHFALEKCSGPKAQFRLRIIGIGELQSAALEGLMKAIYAFRPSLAPFENYARARIVGCVKDAIRCHLAGVKGTSVGKIKGALVHHKSPTSRTNPRADTTFGYEIMLKTVRGDPTKLEEMQWDNNCETAFDEQEAVQAALDKLAKTNRRFALILRASMRGLTLRQTGVMLNLAEARIWQLMPEAKAEFARIYREMNEGESP